MRLSDAIATGRVLPFEINPNSFCSCAIGMGVAAITGRQIPNWPPTRRGDYKAFDIAVNAWPWLLERCYQIPEIALEACDTFGNAWPRYKASSMPFHNIISAIFYNVYRGKVTLEQLIDWVRSVEPVEIEAVSESEALDECPAVA